MQDNSTRDLSPAQARLLEAIQASANPVVVEGERRYTLDGSSLHYAVVEALLRRGILSPDGDRLVLVDLFRDVDKTVEAVGVSGQNDAVDLCDRHAETDALNQSKTVLAANSRARAHDLNRDLRDGGARARESLQRARYVSRDESLFGRLWSRLEGLWS